MVWLTSPSSIHFDCTNTSRQSSVIFEKDDRSYDEASDFLRNINLQMTASTVSAHIKNSQGLFPSMNYNNDQHPINHNYDPYPTIKNNQQTAWRHPHDSQNLILREPANIPLTTINQEQALQVARYLKNYPQIEQKLGEEPLNLARINNRVVPPLQPKVNVITAKDKSLTNIDRSEVHQKSTYQERSDQQSIGLRYDDSTDRKSRSELIFDKNRHKQLSSNPNFQSPVSPAKQLISQAMGGYKPLLLERFDQNCITKSAPITSRCEDHLIKRLSQDSTEGRTVVDVGRRVCCALFWHQDCIARIVLETCPDSSAAAADFLMGSRKLDLSLSCQKFNRDGCNGTSSNFNFKLEILSLSIVCSLLAQMMLIVFNQLRSP